MHDVEPYYRWRDIYQAENDPLSPFYGKEYSEFEFSDNIYGYYIHPQWDYIGSETLYIKILFADYDSKSVILEFIGEWNDTLHNDIMHLKRNVIDELILSGIENFILIGDNVYNFHGSDDEYYSEWFDEIEDGYIVGIGFSNVVIEEWKNYNIDSFIDFGEAFEIDNWRIFNPKKLVQKISDIYNRRIGA